MNAQQIMDLLLKTGREYVDKGVDIVEERLDIPDDPEARKTMLSNAGKGALAAAAIAALLGTKGGRKLTGTTLKLGSLAAVSGLAYQAFKEWQKKDTGQPEISNKSDHKVTADSDDKRSLRLLKTMIAAAQADGHIDQTERKNIVEQIKALDLQSESVHAIESQLHEPIDLKLLAKSVELPEQAAEMYLVARVILNVNEVQERLFLNELATALGLDSDLIDSLENQLA